MSLRPVWSSLDDVSLGFIVRCCLKKPQGGGGEPSARLNEWLTYLSDLAAPPSVTFLMKMPYLRSPVLWGLCVMSASPWQSAEVSARPLGTESQHPCCRPLANAVIQTKLIPPAFQPALWLSLSTVLSLVASPNSHSGYWKDSRATGRFLNFNLSGTMEQGSLDINSEGNRFPRCLKQLLLISAPARCLPIMSQLGCFKEIMVL